MWELPPLVARANEVARQAGFPLTREEAGPDHPSACLPGVGHFLAVLAAGCVSGRIGELGTGAGIGAAWMSSVMPADCALITAEIDERLADAARGLLAEDPRVQVITGDAMAVMRGFGPFDLLFADCGVRDEADFAALVSMLRFGGHIVMDDVCATEHTKRRLFHGEARLVSAEVALPDLADSLLVGTRVR
jgi:predicted O-methyltransferase YrrM